MLIENNPQAAPPSTCCESGSPPFRFLIHPPMSFVWLLLTLTRFPGLSHSSKSHILPSTHILHRLLPPFGILRLYICRLTPHYRLGSRWLLTLHSHSSHFHTRGLTFRPFLCSNSFVLSPSRHPRPQLVNRPSFWWFSHNPELCRVRPRRVRVWSESDFRVVSHKKCQVNIFLTEMQQSMGFL